MFTASMEVRKEPPPSSTLISTNPFSRVRRRPLLPDINLHNIEEVNEEASQQR